MSDEPKRPIVPHTGMSYAELHEYNRQISGLSEAERARLRTQNRLAREERARVRKNRPVE